MGDRDEAGRFQPGHNLPGPGRASEYHPDMNDQATKLALLGLTDEEIALFFGITPQTFYNWMNKFPAFFEAVHAGKVQADGEVAMSLYRKATGITYEVERLRKTADGQSEIVKLKAYEPPDTGAMKLWLTNRRRKDWADSVKVTGTGDEGEHLHKVEWVVVSPKP
jgi:hypothetical protein